MVADSSSSVTLRQSQYYVLFKEKGGEGILEDPWTR